MRIRIVSVQRSYELREGLLRLGLPVVLLAAMTGGGACCLGNDPSGLYTDPQTGTVYRKIRKTVERPVVSTANATRERTVYSPQTVTETRPHSRTVYRPVTEYRWEPRIHNRWNPFARPYIAYHHVPMTYWEAQKETVNRRTSRTEWVAETKTVEVPVTRRKIVRDEREFLEPVGTIRTQQPPGPSSAIASRLRPLEENESYVPGTAGASQPTTARTPSISAGRLASDPPGRSVGQRGQRAMDLSPGGSGFRALPPPSTVATPSAAMRTWR